MEINALYNLFLACNCKISTDTRQLAKGSLFVALTGENFNGNKFALEAIEKGCAAALIDDPTIPSASNVMCVDNILIALQHLANYHRKEFNIPVVSITGTNGKTTTKELVAAVLQKKYKLTYTKGNLNNHIGVPLTLLEINKETEIAVIEMGANHPGEIKLLCEIADPDFGIITNVGKAHLEGFGSFEGVISTKTEMYRYLKNKNAKIFINLDNPILVDHAKEILKFSYGKDLSADIIGKNPTSDPFLEFDWKLKTENHWNYLKSNLVGTYNFENVLAAICIGHYFKVKSSEITEAINEYLPSNNRSQILKTNKNTLLLDAYNANPTSMGFAIENFTKMNAPAKIMIIGDMLELGLDSVIEHENILRRIEDSGIGNYFLIGKVFSEISKSNELSFETVQEFIEYLRLHPIQNRMILVKGSHGIHLEKLIDFL